MNQNLPAVSPLAPLMEVPNDAPMMPFDISNPNLTLDDVMPKNFFNIDDLKNKLATLRQHALVLTITGITMELMYDPATEKASAGKWRPVLHFKETETKLVINKTRGKQLVEISGSPRLIDWPSVGQVAIRPDIINGNGQVSIEAVGQEMTQDEIPF